MLIKTLRDCLHARLSRATFTFAAKAGSRWRVAGAGVGADHLFGAVENLWATGCPLRNLAVSTACRSDASALAEGGLIDIALRSIVAELAAVALEPKEANAEGKGYTTGRTAGNLFSLFTPRPAARGGAVGHSCGEGNADEGARFVLPPALKSLLEGFENSNVLDRQAINAYECET